MQKIPLTRPFLSEEIKALVNDVLESGFWTEGQVTHDFEESLRQFIGVPHVLAVSNCTVGLETALRILGVGPGDEVIVPDYTYPATAFAVQIVGAMPVLVDVNPKTFLIDYDAIEAAMTPRTKVIMPVSIFGNPLDYNRLRTIQKKHGVVILEDAACALGSEFSGVKTGNLADISVFSFHPRKFITTGEGGCITTSRQDWAEKINTYKHFGMAPSATREGTVFHSTGTNYKLSNLQAAVGFAQMKHIDRLLDQRRQLAKRYQELLRDVGGVQLPETTAGGVHSYQSFCILVDRRDEIMKQMRAMGIEVQIGTYALHREPAFQGNRAIQKGKFSGSLYAYEHALALPLYHDLTEEDQDLVVQELITLVK